MSDKFSSYVQLLFIWHLILEVVHHDSSAKIMYFRNKVKYCENLKQLFLKVSYI